MNRLAVSRLLVRLKCVATVYRTESFYDCTYVRISRFSLLIGLLSSITIVSSIRPRLYTLSANAAGNRTLCELCQAKYQRKQTCHRDRRHIEHEATEELDGTREHRTAELCDTFNCVTDSSSRISFLCAHSEHEHNPHETSWSRSGHFFPIFFSMYFPLF